MVGFFFTDEKVTNFEKASTSNLDYFTRYFQEMLQQGVSLPPSQFEGMFLSTKHTEEDIDQTIAAAEIAFSKLK
jgi:glutamate-1-semialdehyde 2,1-aminomutase